MLNMQPDELRVALAEFNDNRMTPAQAAVYIGISETSLKLKIRAVRNGESDDCPKFYEVTRNFVFFKKSDLDNYLNLKKVGE